MEDFEALSKEVENLLSEIDEVKYQYNLKMDDLENRLLILENKISEEIDLEIWANYDEKKGDS